MSAASLSVSIRNTGDASSDVVDVDLVQSLAVQSVKRTAPAPTEESIACALLWMWNRE